MEWRLQPERPPKGSTPVVQVSFSCPIRSLRWKNTGMGWQSLSRTLLGRYMSALPHLVPIVPCSLDPMITYWVYDKECIDPRFGYAHYFECVPVTSFRTGINDDAGLWAGCTTAPARTPVQDGQDRGCPSEAERNYQLRVMGRQAKPWWLP